MLSTRPPTTVRRCTLLLLWLVMLALPLQGFAAAAMVHCAKGPAQSVLKTGPHWQSGDHHAAMASMQAHHHVLDALVQSADTAENSLAPTSHSKAELSIDHSCSACATCCHLMALVTVVPAIEPPTLATASFIELPLPALGIAPRLSKKPPRF